jgi:hypothetical protein
MRAAVALGLLLVASPGFAATPLARLAAAFAEQVAAVAHGRAVELAPPEDRTGRGTPLGLDLRALVAARLEGRVALKDAGPRLRVLSVISEAPRRLIVSARVVEEPGGALVDLLSASAEPAEDLGLSPGPASTTGSVIDVISSARTPPLDAPVLQAVLLGDERVAVLFSDALTLYRIEASGLVQESRQPLPAPFVVRAPAGLLVATRDDALWVLTNRSPTALLFAIEHGRLVRRAEAGAAPWPGCPEGLRYRAGTNLLEGTVAGLGAGPFLAVAGALGVSPEGRIDGAASAARVGPSLAPLWTGLMAASAADPPGSHEDVLLLGSDPDGVWRTAGTLPMEGAVRALAARVHGETARLVAAVEEPGDLTRLVLTELRRRDP